MSMQQYRPTGFSILPLIIKNLLIINGLFFLATMSFEKTFGLDLTRILGLHFPTSEHFKPYQLVSYMFMHGGFSHILFNLFALWMFGSALENVWGPKRFLTYYMVTGIGAAVIQLLVNWYSFYGIEQAFALYQANPTPEAFAAFMNSNFMGYYDPATVSEFVNSWSTQPSNKYFLNESIETVHKLITYKADIPTVGASGAVFGILLAFGMMFPNSLIYVYFFFPIKAKWFVVIYGVIELYSGISNRPGDNVAHFAHLGGMIFGFFLIRYWKKQMNRPTTFY